MDTWRRLLRDGLDESEADEKPVDAARCRVYRAIVGKAQPILTARPDVLYAVEKLSRRLRGPWEVDYVAVKRMVKYKYGTRDIALELRPRKGPLRPDSDWAGCPTTRKSSSGAMVWLSALVSSLCPTRGLMALSSPAAECYACTVGVAEAKVRSVPSPRLGRVRRDRAFC